MADYTKHLRLIKPSGNEYYDIENFNHNAELIDRETEDLSNKVTKIQEGATREKPGIVQFGTEEGKALEGMMLARLAGAYGYGGDIQDGSVKNPNYIYYDRNTRKMYKCLKQNQDISANVANFVPLDNNSLLDRLENLSISAGTEILVKNFSNKSNFTVQEIIWTEEEYRKAIKNYDFISLYFSSSYISIQGPLLTKTTRPYVSIPSANGNTFYLFLAEDRDFIRVMNTVNFSPIRCNELKIYGFKIR
ncbi:hypothetical protein [Fusobacterium nucleatum]|uniref:hypothetical protein n=1 Tax=Fusobacterium nucleatum TaxID=851 RepID=UPI0030CEF893